jgi:hypothetical protein
VQYLNGPPHISFDLILISTVLTIEGRVHVSMYLKQKTRSATRTNRMAMPIPAVTKFGIMVSSAETDKSVEFYKSLVALPVVLVELVELVEFAFAIVIPMGATKLYTF